MTGADAIEALLPQTQCTKCGFDGCRPYAEAIAGGRAPINRCPPGGERGIARLARLLHVPELPLDPECGEHRPRAVARIDEAVCIGCTKCIQACPVDAIVGASKRMHTVIPALCTGCDLCVPPCPVDCIEMVELPSAPEWSDADALAARSRHDARRLRLERERIANEERLAAKAVAKLDALREEAPDESTLRKRAVIEAAIRRARERAAQRAAGDAAAGAPRAGAPGPAGRETLR